MISINCILNLGVKTLVFCVKTIQIIIFFSYKFLKQQIDNLFLGDSYKQLPLNTIKIFFAFCLQGFWFEIESFYSQKNWNSARMVSSTQLAKLAKLLFDRLIDIWFNTLCVLPAHPIPLIFLKPNNFAFSIFCTYRLD